MASKTTYSFMVADPNSANQIIQSWINSLGMQYLEDGDGKYYRCGDKMVSGYKYFEYAFNGNQLTVSAFMGSPKHPHPIETITVWAQEYRSQFNNLLSQLGASSNSTDSASAPANPQPESGNLQAPNSPVPQAQQVANDFQQKQNKTNSTFAIISFIGGIAGLFLPLTGLVWGSIVYIIFIYMSIRGMKSNKKGLAIAGLILNIIAIIITVVVLISSNLK